MRILPTAALALIAMFSACTTMGTGAESDSGNKASGFTIDIPVVYIVLDNPSVQITKSPAVPITARITIKNGADDSISDKPIFIKGHGNATWYYSFIAAPKRKLPYRIEFASKTDMLGMGKAKKWLLLANRFDKSLMKNMLVFDLAQAMSFSFTPRYRLVELYLDGKYKGVYQVTDLVEADESIRVKTGTANPKTDTEPGFLLEWDNKVALSADQGGDGNTAEGVDYFLLENIHQPFAFKSPKAGELDAVPGNAARAYIENYMARASAAIMGSKTGTPGQDAYKQYIDVLSFYDYYIVNELAKNFDAANYSSIFLNKPKDGKLAMGPVWDFDCAFGWLETYQSTDGWYIRDNNPWYDFLIKNNAEFSAGLKARWNEIKPLIRSRLIEGIDRYEAALRPVEGRDDDEWGELDRHINIWTTEQQYPVKPWAYKDVVAYLRQWIKARYEWMDRGLSR
jgi:hypothetical protein